MCIARMSFIVTTAKICQKMSQFDGTVPDIFMKDPELRKEYESSVRMFDISFPRLTQDVYTHV